MGIKKTKMEDIINENASKKNICLEPQTTAKTPARPGPSIPNNCQVALDKEIALP